VCAGDKARTRVADTISMRVAAVAPKWTTVVRLRPAPSIVTHVPPCAGPVLGLTLSARGGGAGAGVPVGDAPPVGEGVPARPGAPAAAPPAATAAGTGCVVGAGVEGRRAVLPAAPPVALAGALVACTTLGLGVGRPAAVLPGLWL
jgi:hypothetical protein